MVIDIPNKKFGSRPVAFIKAKKYQLLKEENIIKSLSAFLPKFKIPDVFYKWPEQQNTFKPNRTEFESFYKNQEVEKIV